jgi:hypothetical protein
MNTIDVRELIPGAFELSRKATRFPRPGRALISFTVQRNRS